MSDDFEIRPVGRTFTQRHMEHAQTTLTGVWEPLRRFYTPGAQDRRRAAMKAGWALDDAIADLVTARIGLLRDLRQFDEELLAELEYQAELALRERSQPTEPSQDEEGQE